MNPIFAELAGNQAEKRREPNIFNSQNFPLVVLSAINAIGVCYYVRISARQEYLDDVATYFRFVVMLSSLCGFQSDPFFQKFLTGYNIPIIQNGAF